MVIHKNVDNHFTNDETECMSDKQKLFRIK